ncbi:MarR family transcriptional regulator [Anaerobacillus sp. HL2]|nr:MarR family transcriptional regulator [Anaerobacillus sp. HL2]
MTLYHHDGISQDQLANLLNIDKQQQKSIAKIREIGMLKRISKSDDKG